MIKVNVEYHNKEVSKVIIHGHANFDDYGKDIVCAAVSTMSQTVVNDIITLDENACSYDVNDGNLTIIINDGNEIAIKLINNMLRMLKELEDSYPQNIKIGGLK